MYHISYVLLLYAAAAAAGLGLCARVCAPVARGLGRGSRARAYVCACVRAGGSHIISHRCYVVYVRIQHYNIMCGVNL